MSGPRIFFANSIGATSEISPSSTSAIFRKGYLIDANRGTFWRSGATYTSAVSATIDITFAVATQINALALVGHNFPTSGGTITLKYGATAPPTHQVSLASIVTGTWVSHFATITAKRWRLTMHCNIASGFAQIGELWLGRYIGLSKFFTKVNVGVEQGHKRLETDGGQRWYLRGFQRQTRSYMFNDIEDGGDVLKWQRVFQNRGNDRPFFFTQNGSVPTSTLFCTLKSGLQFPSKSPNLYDLQIDVEESL